jgi:hypothetical protein
MNIILSYYPFLILVLTIIIEYIIYAIAIRKNFGWLFIYALLINLFTWPLANLIYDWTGMFWLIEFFVFLIEFVLIMLLVRLKWWKALLISLIANLITALISFIF